MLDDRPHSYKEKLNEENFRNLSFGRNRFGSCW
jgi:hypothetical protein